MTNGCLWWFACNRSPIKEASFSFSILWSLYPACSAQAIPSVLGLFRVAKTLSIVKCAGAIAYPGHSVMAVIFPGPPEI